MMSDHPSISNEQIQAEPHALKGVEEMLGVTLINKTIEFEQAKFSFDGVTEEHSLLCEVYAGIGKPKSAQQYKVMQDALKMIAFEKFIDWSVDKYLVFIDEKTKNVFSEGRSWRVKALDKFDIKRICGDIDPTIKNNVIKAKKRQYR